MGPIESTLTFSSDTPYGIGARIIVSHGKTLPYRAVKKLAQGCPARKRLRFAPGFPAAVGVLPSPLFASDGYRVVMISAGKRNKAEEVGRCYFRSRRQRSPCPQGGICTPQHPCNYIKGLSRVHIWGLMLGTPRQNVMNWNP